jgi:UDP:flavonoid glycosyltransferase YjiC (YdhE family)
MGDSLRVTIGTAGWTGHAFPAIALGRELRSRGHEVQIETFERWREVVEELGIRFAPAPEHVVFPGPKAPGEVAPTLPEAVRTSVEIAREFAPDVAISDLFSLVPAYAAEMAAIPGATLIPHPYPELEPSLPSFAWGYLPPRTPVGGLMWRVGRALAEAPGRRRAAELLNHDRAELGLPPLDGATAHLSTGLALVATLPQLEYPRAWPAHVHVTGPLPFELPYPDVELPEGEDPLVLVAASTQQDPELRLISVALEALEREPVRVQAAINRRGESWPGAVPENAQVVDWLSYSQVLPRAALMIARGGHGTLARALVEGVPVLACPFEGDMALNSIRLAWSGAGLMLPRRLVAPASMRWAVRRLLAEPSFARRAAEIAEWSRANHGPTRAADLIEAYAAR